MSAEVFRFVTIRPPQQVDGDEATGTVITLERSDSPLVDTLRNVRKTNSRPRIEAAAQKFVASADFVGSSHALDASVSQFVAALQQLGEHDFLDGANGACRRIFGARPSAVVKSDVYLQSFARTSDSIVASAIDRAVPSKTRSFLVRVVRALWLVRRLADDAPVSRRAFANAPLILPSGIFPLPVNDSDLRGQRVQQAKDNAAAVAARQQRLAQLATDLDAYRQAADEILTTFALGTTPTTTPSAGNVLTPSGGTTRPAGSTGFVLSGAAAASLSDSTKNTFKKIGVSTDRIDVARAITVLDKQAASAATRLFTAAGPRNTIVRLGGRFVPSDALSGGYTVVVDPGPPNTQSPGPCPPVVDTTPPDDTASVPVGHGEARILGIADLLVVEQELLRYEYGEIAHIENVLKSETRSRRFKTSDTTEVSQTTETETTTEKEQDLSSTERFELKTESQTIISDNASKQAGLTIHASYGPSVDATANYNTTSSTSSSKSDSASSNFAREVTTKAVDRVQTRTLTRRTETRTHLVEEINRHGFDNKTGTADIVGIYRFIDKIYLAQIINYGKRLMLEFIVPEPAAFLRYALTNKPLDTVTQVNPDRPGYCLADGTTFVPLQATDITADNYVYWASKYGAQDVTPPPPTVYLATGSKKSPDQMATVESDGPRNISSDIFDVTIPDGYLCQQAFINIYGETQAGVHKVVYQLQELQGEYIEPSDDNILYTLQPTPTLTVSINSIGFHNYEVVVTAFCTLSLEALRAWQLKTFASIMAAYNELKSAFDQAIQEAKLRASDLTISGSNPATNEITEQTELKKGCVSLLTGQRFDLFDAVARNVAPFGYPEIDFIEAQAEGLYISFFEQSFEWNNMVYVFYPYFWGKKSDWVTVAQLTDTDPLFAQFLRAGAARVQVPVRVGFEEAMLTYLSTGELWAGEGSLGNSEDGDADPLHLSIIAELKSQTDNNNVDGVGTLTVTKNATKVTGSGTAFTADDMNKRIVIAGAIYVIKSVQDAKTIQLTTPYAGESADGVGYAIGGKLVGQPWEVKLPTDLIKLDGSIVIH